VLLLVWLCLVCWWPPCWWVLITMTEVLKLLTSSGSYCLPACLSMFVLFYLAAYDATAAPVGYVAAQEFAADF
jgi:hypothetical protein